MRVTKSKRFGVAWYFGANGLTPRRPRLIVARMESSGSEPLRVEAKPDTGCERFLSIEVHVGEAAATPDWYKPLNGRAKAVLCELLGEPPYLAVMGRVQAAWKDEQARQDCIAYQLGWKASRWDDVQKYAALLKSGKSFDQGPSFIHPTVTASPELLLRPIDGARRLMAAAEAGGREIPAVIVLGKDADTEFDWEVSSFGTFDNVLLAAKYGHAAFKMPMQTFTREDVNASLIAKRFESMAMNWFNRETQKAEANPEYLRQWRDAEARGGNAWHDWFRDYNIRRIAYLVEHGIGREPIVLRADGSRVDGNHRLLAAICRGERSIRCVFEHHTSQ